METFEFDQQPENNFSEIILTIDEFFFIRLKPYFTVYEIIKSIGLLNKSIRERLKNGKLHTSNQTIRASDQHYAELNALKFACFFTDII